MICKKCGAEFDNDLKACPECSCPVDTEDTVEEIIGDEVVDTDLVDDTDDDDENTDNVDGNEDDDDDDDDADDEDNIHAGRTGLIIAIIAVLLVIVVGGIIFFASKKDYSNTSSLQKFFFSLKSEESKHFLDGVWQVSDSENYYSFDGDKAGYYKGSALQQEYTVKYVSQNEILLSVTEDGMTYTQSMKPKINEKDKTLELQVYYQYLEISDDAMGDTAVSMSKVDELPKPFSIEEKMSQKQKDALQGTWKGSNNDGDDVTIVINDKKATFEDNEWEALYAADGELVFKMYIESYGIDYYYGFDYTIKDGTLTMTVKYQVVDGDRQDVDSAEQTVFTLKKQTEDTKKADK